MQKKAEQERRNEEVRFYLSKPERNRAEVYAKKNDIPLSQFCRRLVLDAIAEAKA
jgi:hypothetical protein